MKGILKSVELKEYVSKETGKKFRKLNFVVDVLFNDKSVETLKGSYGEQFARDYFKYCNVKTKDLIGKEVGVVLAKKSFEAEGEIKTYKYIKYLNVLDSEGYAIVMKKDSENTIDF